MIRFSVLVFAVLLLPGCSMLIERSAQYSEYALEEGHTREEIAARIGEPLCTYASDSDRQCDVYMVRGRVFDSGDYWATRAAWPMTLGIAELVFFPKSLWEVMSESVNPTEKELQMCGSEKEGWWLTESKNGSFCKGTVR